MLQTSLIQNLQSWTIKPRWDTPAPPFQCWLHAGFSVHGIHSLFLRNIGKGERGLMLSSELKFTNIMTKCPNSFVQDCSSELTVQAVHPCT